LNIFFDVQGTLISGGVSRPGVREVFEELVAEGHRLYVWSSGGPAYASEAARALGVADLVSGYYGKSNDPEVEVDYAVDDSPMWPETFGGYQVSQFAGDPQDRELWAVLEDVRGA
jgi:phosphoglycolate phosphatase-like HAD superfamily hydrolase